MSKKRPLDVLHTALDQRVIVHLRGRREYRGTLHGYDHPHLNLVLKNAEEVLNAGTDAEKITKRDLVVIRGDSIIYVSP
jgi:U6 snRNA-associated Sm-like protein LSm3